jgi:hypothetical protein
MERIHGSTLALGIGRQRFTSFSNEESLSLTMNSSANSINCILSLKTIGRVDTFYAE